MLSGCYYITLLLVLHSGYRQGERSTSSGLLSDIRIKRMVATSDCGEKAKHGTKVSKPLMEKKRRARINQCLDELKSLLESYYSSSIRKRKLEKADILELTVTHLRNLQKIQNASVGASECRDYQLGFRSCLVNANEYLLLADQLNGSGPWTQLSSKLYRFQRRGEASSTTDSDPGHPDALEEARNPRLQCLNGHEESKPVQPTLTKPQTAHTVSSSPSVDKYQLFESKPNDVLGEKIPARSIEPESVSHKIPEFVSLGQEAENKELNVWRPW
ncbi:PREDICTED: transcription factor HES-3 [Cyprinodon variegatus]|uniref:transcription factor HES-3 n=1 Tax=Cyprinodon variegatus TaxID=28743 RepID=UPI000742930C|nr:PREDICTED: transcription factor HES-3 [Cyprinodon variegatus]